MGAQDGVEKVSSKRLAKICGISNGTIFNRFGTMRSLLDEAAQSFDRPHMEETINLANNNLSIYQIWDNMLDSFLADPDGTLYYISYTNVFGFDPTADNPRANEFLQIAKPIFQAERELSDTQYLIMWDYLTSMAFYYAEKFIHGYLDYDEPTKGFIKQVVFGGITGILYTQPTTIKE